MHDILGTTAKAAVADAALGLYRNGQGKRETTLKATGRDIDEIELALEWDGATCCWQLLGEAGEVRKDTANAEVRDAIAALVDLGQVPSTARIARYLGKAHSQVSRSLGELLNAGQGGQDRPRGALLPGRPGRGVKGERGMVIMAMLVSMVIMVSIHRRTLPTLPLIADLRGWTR